MRNLTISHSLARVKNILFRNRFIFLRSFAKSKEKLKNGSVCGSVENKSRATRPRYTLYMHIKNEPVKSPYLRLHKSRSTFWALFWFLEKFLNPTTSHDFTRGPWGLLNFQRCPLSKTSKNKQNKKNGDDVNRWQRLTQPHLRRAHIPFWARGMFAACWHRRLTVHNVTCFLEFSNHSSNCWIIWHILSNEN